MVTKINRDVTKSNEVTETKEAMTGRVSKLVSTACKLSLEANSAKRNAFAGAMAFALLHGELRFVNDLYSGMSREDQEAMRIFALSELAVQFDPNAKREIQDGKEKWIVRPVNFVDFRATPKAGEDHITWSDIKPKDSDTAAIQETKARRKATKVAARKALEKHGETVLAFEWVREERIGTIGTEFTEEKFFTSIATLLRKYAALPNKSKGEVLKIAQAAGLPNGDITKIGDAWEASHKEATKADNDKAPAASQENNEGERKVA